MMPPEIYFAKTGRRQAPTLPADAVTRTFGIFGVKDSGKTTTARVIAEGIVRLGGYVVVLDPVGVWWGMTRAGTGPGCPGIVIGGEHGDVPLEATGGQLVAELCVARQWQVVVIDLKLLRKGEAQRFMADFLEAVYFANRRPLHVIFEEADRALPQSPRGMDPTLGRVMGAAEDIVKLGRSRGLGSTFISQRMATVTKNVVEQVEALLLHRQIGPRDRKAVKDWIESNGDAGVTAKVLDSMASLEQGEAWLYSPGWLRLLERVRMKVPRTLDSSSTPTDDEREVEESAKRAPVNLDELGRLMAETVERAKANDPAVLKKRIEELEKKLSIAEWAEERVVETQRVLVPDPEGMATLAQCVASIEAAQGDFEQQFGLARDAMRDAVGLAERTFSPLAGCVAELSATLDRMAALPAEGVALEEAPRPERQREPRVAAGTARGVSSNGTVSAGTEGLVQVLRGLYPLAVDRGQLALLARRGSKSSTLTQQIADAKAAGLIEDVGGGRFRAVSGESDSNPSPEQLRERFLAVLPDGPRALFEVVVRERELTRVELFMAAGFSPTSSTPVSHLKLLKDNALVTTAAGAVRLGSLVGG